jgi:hypothetical protein
MKRIRKFNESADREIDAAYVRHCFADLMDEGKAMDVEKSSAAYGSWIEIHCLVEFPEKPELDLYPRRPAGSSWVTNTRKIGDHAKKLEEAAGAMREIETCIQRLADEYPNYSYKIGSDNSVLFGELRRVINVIIFP